MQLAPTPLALGKTVEGLRMHPRRLKPRGLRSVEEAKEREAMELNYRLTKFSGKELIVYKALQYLQGALEASPTSK